MGLTPGDRSRNFYSRVASYRYHLICPPSPSPRGTPPPGSLSPPGVWASPLEVGLELLFQDGYPGYCLICTPSPLPQERLPLLGPISLVFFPTTQISPTTSVSFSLMYSSALSSNSDDLKTGSLRGFILEKNTIFLQVTVGNPVWARYISNLPACVANHSKEFGSSCPFMEIAM